MGLTGAGQSTERARTWRVGRVIDRQKECDLTKNDESPRGSSRRDADNQVHEGGGCFVGGGGGGGGWGGGWGCGGGGGVGVLGGGGGGGGCGGVGGGGVGGGGKNRFGDPESSIQSWSLEKVHMMDLRHSRIQMAENTATT